MTISSTTCMSKFWGVFSSFFFFSFTHRTQGWRVTKFSMVITTKCGITDLLLHYTMLYCLVETCCKLPYIESAPTFLIIQTERFLFNMLRIHKPTCLDYSVLASLIQYVWLVSDFSLKSIDFGIVMNLTFSRFSRVNGNRSQRSVFQSWIYMFLSC